MNSISKAKYTDQYSFCLKAIRQTNFKIWSFFISLYYIVFANILITFMKKLAKSGH